MSNIDLGDGWLEKMIFGFAFEIVFNYIHLLTLCTNVSGSCGKIIAGNKYFSKLYLTDQKTFAYLANEPDSPVKYCKQFAGPEKNER